MHHLKYLYQPLFERVSFLQRCIVTVDVSADCAQVLRTTTRLEVSNVYQSAWRGCCGVLSMAQSGTPLDVEGVLVTNYDRQ